MHLFISNLFVVDVHHLADSKMQDLLKNLGDIKVINNGVHIF